MLGRFDHGAVAGDIGHRTQRIHLLRARNARHAVHRHHRRAALRQFLEEFGILCRPQETDQRLSRTQLPGFGIVGCADLHDDVAARPDGGGRIEHLAPCGTVCVVRKARLRAGSGFHSDLEAELDQLGSDVGRRGDAALSGIVLSGYTDFHSNPSVWNAAV